MSIANYFTLLRIFLSPVFLFTYLEYEYLGISFFYLPFVLLFLLVILELSDAFDGYLARRFNQVTDLGKILDPMADSIARTSIFLTFTQGPIDLPLAFIFVFLYRDTIISTLRTICALKGFTLAARWTGKVKALIQGVAAFTIIIMMIPYNYGLISLETLQTISRLAVGSAAVYAIYSGIDYLYANKSYIARLLTLHPIKSTPPQV